MAKTIYGAFSSSADADKAISDLMTKGFEKSDFSVVSREKVEVNETVEQTTVEDNITEATSGGALTGGAVGAVAGLLVGIGAIALPPIGGIFIAGPIAAALGISTAASSTIAGAGLGALGGGLVGALTGLGLPEEDARFYEERVTNNGVLLSVVCDSDEDHTVVKDAFNSNGAERISIVG